MKRGLKFKGQISIFLILGILIVVTFVFVGYNLKVKNDERLNKEFFSQEEIKSQVENIQMNIYLCIDDSGTKGLETLGKQGGYYKRPLKYLDMNGTFVPYYYYQGEYLNPSLDEVTKELEGYIEEKVDLCLKGLNFDGFILTYSKPLAKAVIDEDKVVFQVDSKVSIIKEKRNMIVNLEDDIISKPIKLKDIIDLAGYITDSHKVDSKKYCISCVEEKAKEKDVYVSFYPISNDSVFVIIGENKSSDMPYLFSFLNKYTGKELSDDLALTGEFSNGLPGNSGGIEQ